MACYSHFPSRSLWEVYHECWVQIRLPRTNNSFLCKTPGTVTSNPLGNFLHPTSVADTSMHRWVLSYSQEDHPLKSPDQVVLESLANWVSIESSLHRIACLDSLPCTIWETQGPQVLTIIDLSLFVPSFCGPCSFLWRNCSSYLVHPFLFSSRRVKSWLDLEICSHYLTKPRIHPPVLIFLTTLIFPSTLRSSWHYSR